MAIYNGGVYSATENNTEFGRAKNAIMLVLTNEYSNPTGWTGLKNSLEFLKYDVLQTSGAINMSLSTGSWVSGLAPTARYQAQLYTTGSVINGGFETSPWTSGTNWFSGATSNFFVSGTTSWTDKTGTNHVIFAKNSNNTAGSSFVSQRVQLGATGYNTLRFDYAATAGGGAALLFKVLLGGSTLLSTDAFDSLTTRNDYEIDITGYTGSPVLVFMMQDNGASATTGSIVVDDILLLRAGSTNTIPSSFIATINNTNRVVKGGALYVNGSFPTGTTGSYFLSTNSGTNWEGVNPGSYVDFSNQSSGLTVKVDLYSSGAGMPRIYEYGVQWSED